MKQVINLADAKLGPVGNGGKFGVSSFAGAGKPTLRFLGRKETSLDYFDGED